MKNKDELAKGLSGQIVTDTMKGIGVKDKSALIRLILSTIALLAVIGEEGVQVIFRKNFGKKGLSPFRIVACSILLGVISFLSFKSFFDIDFRFVEANSTTFVLSGIFYLIFALLILIKGFVAIKEAEDSKEHPEFAGDSELLSFLVKENKSNQQRVQLLEEPVLVLAIGVLISSINFLWGLPLVYCAFSVWINKIVETIFFDPIVNEQSNQQSNRRDFSSFDN
jgi:hypothetical protein